MGKTYEEIMEIVGKTAEISYENSKSTAVVLEELKKQKQLLGGLSNTVTAIGDSVEGLKNEIDSLKLNEEITTEQADVIRRSAERRVVEILGDDVSERQKYFPTFIRNLYSDAKKNAGLGSRIECTKKGNYQRVIDFIEAWIPSCGCAALRIKADKNAKARLEAKKLGYVA